MKRAKAFTLIELLIVVAIIAILAAIAVPNFLEAQTRAKVARVKNDLRSQATGIQAYAVDWNVFTRDNDSDMDREAGWVGVPFEWKANGAVQLTTPVAYLTSLLKDPFTGAQANNVTGGLADGYRIGSGTWSYRVSEGGLPDNQGAAGVFDTNGKSMCFVTLSPGPDKKRERIGYKAFPFKGTGTEIAPYIDYDPTNGTISGGDIYRFGGSFQQGNWDRIATNAGPRGPEAN